MLTTPEQIDLWISAPSEHQRLEFKEAKNQFDNDKLYRYCVAIANEGGRQLLLGVSDQRPRKIVGTTAFNNPLGMAEKLFGEIGFRVDIEEVAHPGGRVLVFHIPSRPAGTAYHLRGAYWMRSGEQLVPMTEDQLRRIFNEGSPEWGLEKAAENVSEQDVVELLDTQTFFELLKLPYPSARNGVIERLKAESLIGGTATGTGAGAHLFITRLGALLLAKNLADFPTLSRKAPRVVVYEGHSKTKTKSDVAERKGYAVGFQNLVRYIMSQLPQNEVIEDTLRKEMKLVPEIVIRELVANALIHQDLRGCGPE